MTETYITVGDEDFAPREAKLFAEISKTSDHTYAPESIDEATRTSIDMLVLSGFVERFRSPDGQWLDAWTITSEAVAWMSNLQTREDLDNLLTENA